MVTTTALLIGGTSLTALISSLVIGLFNIYKSKKLEANLLLYAGLLTISTGCFYLGASVDFLSILIFGKNMPNENGLHGILSFTSVAPAMICAMYLGSELLIPEKKKIIVILYTIIGIIFELFLYLDTMNAFNFSVANPGEDTIDSTFVLMHPTFLIVVFTLLSTLVFCGIGFLIKARQSSGIIRKKFSYISIGFFIFVLCGALDALVSPGFWLIFIRFGMVFYAWIVYYGLKP